jgi:hypothetical protein
MPDALPSYATYQKQKEPLEFNQQPRYYWCPQQQ